MKLINAILAKLFVCEQTNICCRCCMWRTNVLRGTKQPAVQRTLGMVWWLLGIMTPVSTVCFIISGNSSSEQQDLSVLSSVPSLQLKRGTGFSFHPPPPPRKEQKTTTCFAHFLLLLFSLLVHIFRTYAHEAMSFQTFSMQNVLCKFGMRIANFISRDKEQTPRKHQEKNNTLFYNMTSFLRDSTLVITLAQFWCVKCAWH